MIKSVVCIIVNSKNQILLLKRTDMDGVYPSIYCLPGGKLEPGELPPVGMIREVYEETGIKIREYTQYTVEEDIAFYISKTEHYNVRLSDEHDSFLITSDIEKIPLGPITKKVLRNFYKNNPLKK
jgi:8-oxo-dGTP pyrophosphatase MutT (NUDIX family)